MREPQFKKSDIPRFRKLLEQRREALAESARKARGGEVHLDPDDFPDETDAAVSENELSFISRLRDREAGLLRKINAALARLDDGSFGYCEECEEPIGLKRLEARAVATLCIDCKAREELLERR
jgi:DnaK suppressor protein